MLLACMAYVDLNPIRAGLSETLEGSDYTSIQERIQAYVQAGEGVPEANQASSFPLESAPAVPTEPGMAQENGESGVLAASLVEFTGTTGETESGLPFHFSDYLELVDWTGRAIREDKRGYTQYTWNFRFLWERLLAAIRHVQHRSRQDAAPTTELLLPKNRKMIYDGYTFLRMYHRS